MKPIFFTSDWHVGHENCIIFDDRPFTSIEHMHRVLINNYNSTVPEDGVCYFLGDVGLCKKEIMYRVISQLNGTKILVLGNHDKGMTSMYGMGFDAVMYGAMLQIAKHQVTMSHCPLKGVYREKTENMRGAVKGENWHGERRHDAFTFPDWGQFHLHGHIHSPNGGKSKKILGKQFDVGVVANNYRPVSMSVIESWIAKFTEGVDNP